MLGLRAFAELPFATLREDDRGLTGVVTFYFSNGKFITDATDDPVSTQFDPCVIQPLLFDRALPVSSGSPMAFGGTANSNGSIVLANLDGHLDGFLTGFTVDGRRVRVRVGRRGDAIADFQTVFDGTAVGFEHTESEITIRLRSNLQALEQPAQETLYLGSGGTEGGADLADAPKPFAYGELENITAVIVDGTNKIYQINDGATQDITAVYEGGATLTLTTDYTLDLTNGRFTLVASPARLITVQAKGGKASGTYYDTAANIARRILIERAGYDAGDLDGGAFDQLASDQPATTGIYQGPQVVKSGDLLDRLLRPLGIFLTDDRNGRVTTGRFASGLAFDGIALDQRDILSIERRPAPLDPPAKQIQVGYGHNWTVQQQDIAGIVTLTRKQFLAVSQRLATAGSTLASNAHLLAQSPDPVPALFADETDAQDEADRLIELHATERAIYVVRTKVKLWQTRLNQMVRLTYPRWDLRTGADGWIVRITEDAQRGEQTLEIFV